jgi:hypothetical protein
VTDEQVVLVAVETLTPLAALARQTKDSQVEQDHE